jgi:hypothetical protein
MATQIHTHWRLFKVMLDEGRRIEMVEFMEHCEAIKTTTVAFSVRVHGTRRSPSPA